MKQAVYGLIFWTFLALPPVAELLESMMIIHMHMQMPLLVATGMLMAGAAPPRLARFLDRWNGNGVPGIALFTIVMGYWMLPRAMDDAIASPAVEAFKFLSLPLLAGLPLRHSWPRLSGKGREAVLLLFMLLFFGVGGLYIRSPVQLCNNYLPIEQVTLGWGFVTLAICLLVYIVYAAFFPAVDRSSSGAGEA